MMNNKERIERILAWQMLHNKNFIMTSMAMSVALLLSACGGSSDGDSGAADGGKELDLLTYLDQNDPVTEGEDYITFNFETPIKVKGSPELGLEFLLDGDWVTVSSAMNTAQTNNSQLSFNEPYKVTYKGKVVDSLDDLPGLEDMSDVELYQFLSTGTLELSFPSGASVEIQSDPPVVLSTGTVLADDTFVAMLVAGDDDADADVAGDDDADADVADADDADANADADDDGEDALGDRSLGIVVVEDGEGIQIRSLHAISGDVAFLGEPMARAVDMAVADYGKIHGFKVDVGTWLDDLCSADGGQAAAQTIVADDSVVGVLGTSCSGAATAAAPLITDANMVLISGSNSSPSLTSDLFDHAGDNWSAGYYRTAHNDLYQGAAAAKFAVEVLEAEFAATIHDGDPYTEGLATAFANSFSALGGVVTMVTEVNKGDTDMVPVLTDVAEGSPDVLFFPIFQPEGDFIIQQADEIDGLESTTLMAADGLLNFNYLSLLETEGMYFSGPDLDFWDNKNEATGQTADGFLADYEAKHGEAPEAPFWAHAYDATTLLLDAIEAASYNDGSTLVIDRAGVRDYLNKVDDYSGIIGTLSCDAYGDCGSQRIAVIQNSYPENYLASLDDVVYTYSPEEGGTIIG